MVKKETKKNVKKDVPVKKQTVKKTTSKVKSKKTSEVLKATDMVKKMAVPTEKQMLTEVLEREKKINKFSLIFSLFVWAELIALIVLFSTHNVYLTSKRGDDLNFGKHLEQMQRSQNQKMKKISKKNTAQKEQVKQKKASGCPCSKQVERTVSFDDADYAAYAQKGEAKIEGKICAKLLDGKEKCFPKVDVFVNPVTPYSDEWYAKGWAGRENLKAPDKRAWNYQRKTKTDENGNFVIADLPEGSYYVGSLFCLPMTSDDKACRLVRYGAKVKVKGTTPVQLEMVYP